MMNSDLFIDTDVQLHEFLDAIADEKLLALDTEFVREKTYYPKLCLIQIATPDWTVCIDMLAGMDLAPLFDRVLRPETAWVLHSARQDLEVLFLQDERSPSTLIDTQMAAALLGYAPQIGLQGLLMDELSVEVEKGHARTDWSRRPLPTAAVDYALDDVRHLLPLWQELDRRLRDLRRESWFASDCKNALAIPPITPPVALWSRLRGLRSMDASQQVAALALVNWRERLAQSLDRPRRWIMSDELLARIARTTPRDVDSLKAIPEMPPRLVDRSGKAIVAEIQNSEGEGDIELLERHLNQERPSKSALQRLQAKVQRRATELGIQSEVLATRKEMTELLIGRSSDRIDGSWRDSELQLLVAANA
ncbi:MAG: ribonuclease D [Gammaproteobacteria bacterium]